MTTRQKAGWALLAGIFTTVFLGPVLYSAYRDGQMVGALVGLGASAVLVGLLALSAWLVNDEPKENKGKE